MKKLITFIAAVALLIGSAIFLFHARVHEEWLCQARSQLPEATDDTASAKTLAAEKGSGVLVRNGIPFNLSTQSGETPQDPTEPTEMPRKAAIGPASPKGSAATESVTARPSTPGAAFQAIAQLDRHRIVESYRTLYDWLKLTEDEQARVTDLLLHWQWSTSDQDTDAAFQAIERLLGRDRYDQLRSYADTQEEREKVWRFKSLLVESSLPPLSWDQEHELILAMHEETLRQTLEPSETGHGPTFGTRDVAERAARYGRLQQAQSDRAKRILSASQFEAFAAHQSRNNRVNSEALAELHDIFRGLREDTTSAQ